MPVDVIGWIARNPQLVLTGVLALVLVAWAYEAYDEAEDALEAGKGFGGRVKQGTGGLLNIALVGLVTIIGWAATTFETAGEAVVFILELVPMAPVLAASVFSISLGALGLSDVIVLRTWHFVLVSLIALGLGLAYRTEFRVGARR